MSQNLPENQKNENCVTYGDITFDYTNYKNGMTYNKNAITLNFSRYGDEKLSDTKKAYFDLCMPLAVEAGLINADAKLGFVSVQGRSGTNSEWGSTFNIAISFVDISENKYYTLTFVFDDNRTSGTSIVDEINKAIESGNYSATIRSENTIISGDQIFEFSEAMEGIVKYTIPDKNQE